MVVPRRTSSRQLAILAGAIGSILFGAEAALAEPGGSFLVPSNSMPHSARASRGVAEQSIRSYRQEESSPSDLPQRRPPTPPQAQNELTTPPASDQSSTEAEEAEAEEEMDEAEEADPSLLPAHWHNIGGIQWNVLYTGEVFNNMRGGLSTTGATRYRGNTDIVFTYDTEANNLWNGGQFFVYGTNTHGRGLSEQFVGDWQYFSNIDSAPKDDLMQVSEYWYMHTFGDGVFSVKLGKADANADFATIDIASNFINSSFALSPNITLPTWPNQGLGAIGMWQPYEKLLLSAGIYDGAANGGGWGFSTLGDNGAFLIGQAMWTPQFGANEDMPGTYRMGVWRHTGDFAFVDDEEAYDDSWVSTSGLFVNMEQLIWKEADTEEQGLGIFGKISVADGPERFNRIGTHWALGLVYRGWCESRDQDVMGVGLTNINFHDGTAATINRTYETAIEAFYRFQITPWSSIQPDFQYICNPSGNGNDAFVGGFRFQTAF